MYKAPCYTFFWPGEYIVANRRDLVHILVVYWGDKT